MHSDTSARNWLADIANAVDLSGVGKALDNVREQKAAWLPAKLLCRLLCCFNIS